MSDNNQLIKDYFRRMGIIILIIASMAIFIKMCSVTALDIHNREPLRQIDNWE